MGKLLACTIDKLIIFIKEQEAKNQYYELCALGLKPSLYRKLLFDYRVYEDNEQNRILKNDFQLFYIVFLFKKIEDYIKFYSNDLIESTRNKKIISQLIDTYSNYNIIVEKIKGKNYFIIIDYREIATIFLQFERNRKFGTNIYNLLLEVQYSQINSIFFYIFPIFLNWINANNISVTDVDSWQNFFTFNDLGNNL